MAPHRRDLPLLDRPTDLAAEYAAAGSLAALAAQLGVSSSTVRRAMVRHGIRRKQRNANRRGWTASVLDDAEWLRTRYANSTGVELAAELAVSPTTVYRALRRHGIERRRSGQGQHQRRDARLSNVEWLAAALPQSSSTQVAKRLHVSPGTVTNAYRRANLDPRTTRRFHDRGRLRPRPSPESLRSAWDAEGSIREVARRFDSSHTSARVWLAEIGIFATSVAGLSKRELRSDVADGRSIRDIAVLRNVSTSTVRVELHRHGLFDTHRHRHLGEPQRQECDGPFMGARLRPLQDVHHGHDRGGVDIALRPERTHRGRTREAGRATICVGSCP